MEIAVYKLLHQIRVFAGFVHHVIIAKRSEVILESVNHCRCEYSCRLINLALFFQAIGTPVAAVGELGKLFQSF